MVLIVLQYYINEYSIIVSSNAFWGYCNFKLL